MPLINLFIIEFKMSKPESNLEKEAGDGEKGKGSSKVKYASSAGKPFEGTGYEGTDLGKAVTEFQQVSNVQGFGALANGKKKEDLDKKY